MRILRVLIAAPPDPRRADAWALFSSEGRVLERGRSVPSAWPAADRREAVLAADAVRVATLALPPLGRSRLIAAATYALSDRLATSANDAAIAVGERRADGRVNAVVVAREISEALRVASVAFARVLAEPQLAPDSTFWRWCEGPDSAFVRTSEGNAFPVSRGDGAALPPELAMALAQAARDGRSPPEVIADRQTSAELLAAWQHAGGVAFRAGTPWRWEEATPAAFAQAQDLLLAGAQRTTTPSPPFARAFTPALAIAALALALHVVATTGSWAWRRIELARVEHALVPLAQQAGANDASLGDPAQAIAKLHADASHRAGLAAPGDAMPLLARASPALAVLPHGTLKTATFGGGAWTLDFAPLDDARLRSLVSRLSAAGLSVRHATTPGGVRFRVTSAP